MKANEFKVLLGELKKILKDRGLTYAGLANEMGISEAGVKRVFSSTDAKVSTLARVCDALGFSFLDLLQSAKIAELEINFLSDEQDKYFAKNFDALIFFIELLMRKKSTAQIKKDQNLSPSEVERYLLVLERLQIIKRSGEGRIKFLLMEPIGIKPDGHLRKILIGKFTSGMIPKLLNKDEDSKNRFLQTREWMLSKENAAELKLFLEEIFKTFDQKAARDHRMLDANALVPVSIISGILLEESPFLPLKNYRTT